MNPIAELARSCGIQTSYYDSEHIRRSVSRESVIAVLRALGAPVEDESDAAGALRERRRALWERTTNPVIVAWDGELDSIGLRLPAPARGTIAWTLETETGEIVEGAQDAGDARSRWENVEGVDYAVYSLRINRMLPPGYHALTLETGGTPSSTLIISAPAEAYDAFGAGQRRAWGAFAPLYALRSFADWGAGDFGDLERFTQWIAGKGGSAVMTLPLLASFLDEPFNPSPYSPVSRLLWNELYIDIEAVSELAHCPEARDQVASPGFKESRHALRRTDLVDYRGVMALKRRILEQLAICLFESPSSRRDAMEAWANANPNARDYAHFRGTMERRSAIWPDWPEPMRSGRIGDGDYDPAAARYHLYAQWLAETQIREVTNKAAERGVSLFFDMPLGVDHAGYDVWRQGDSFAEGVNAGAPPDTFFARGQDWGFPPISPEGDRAHGYRYFRASIAHLLRIAGLLRIDHVMGLHRLYWIPQGMAASEGAYVQYPADELYAILCLESHRHKAAIMGEDLGTVPHFVRRKMSRHNLLRSYVLQFELPGEGPIRRPPRKSVAALNTHDMPPFAAFWNGLDIEDRLSLGDIDAAGAERQRRERAASRGQFVAELRRSGKLEGDGKGAPVAASIRWLMDSRASAVLVNVEDLLQETQPQNVPGTTGERPNWRRKLRYGVEEFDTLPQVKAVLAGHDAETTKARASK